MSKTRIVKQVLTSVPTLEGAGVHLKRAFGYHQVPLLDPFLMLDHFESSNPADYEAGFPWHPHRGIETISYVLEGVVEHGDSMGNKGAIGAGDVQWMTAGSGIIHQEMPKGSRAQHRLLGFQLWSNLPASHKMMAPRYQEIASHQIPELTLANGIRVRLICGRLEGKKGPVRDIITDPEYLDVTMPSKTVFQHPVKPGHTVFAYVFKGSGQFDPASPALTGTDHVLLFGDGDEVVVASGEIGVRFLLVSGNPLGEPVAWQGPIVMNTDAELATAFKEFSNGTFLKHSR